MQHEKHPDDWTDLEFILKYGAQAQEQGTPVPLGDLQRPGWTARIPTYVVWCRDCQFRESRGFSVPHESGYARRIECVTCRKRFARPGDRAPTSWPVTAALVVLVLLFLALALR